MSKRIEAALASLKDLDNPIHSRLDSPLSRESISTHPLVGLILEAAQVNNQITILFKELRQDLVLITSLHGELFDLETYESLLVEFLSLIKHRKEHELPLKAEDCEQIASFIIGNLRSGMI